VTGLGRLAQLLGVAAGGDVVGGGAEHADQLGHDVLLGELGDGREGGGVVGGLGDGEVAGGEGGDLREVGNAEDLAAGGEVAQLLADDTRHQPMRAASLITTAPELTGAPASYAEGVRRLLAVQDGASVAFAAAEDLEGRFTDTPRDRFWMALDVSAYSLVACARAAEPLMEAAGGGSIVTMTYLGGERAVVVERQTVGARDPDDDGIVRPNQKPGGNLRGLFGGAHRGERDRERQRQTATDRTHPDKKRSAA